MSPRVLAIIDSLKLGGPGRGLQQIAQRAAAHNVDFQVANFIYGGNHDTEFIRSFERADKQLLLVPQKHRLDTSPIGQLTRYVRQNRFNIIQSHGYKSHIVACATARRCDLPWVSVSHGWTNEDVKIRLYNAIERFIIRYADVSVTVSQALYEELSSIRGPRRTTELVGNAVDVSAIQQDDPPNDVRREFGIGDKTLVFGVFGRLSFEKGQDLLLEAMAMIATSDEEKFALLMVGSGPMRQVLQAKADELGIADRAHFAGHRDDIYSCYKAIDILVLPSRSEGMPNVVLEACALGKAVVAANVGDVSKIISDGENGWLFEPGSAQALANRLMHVLHMRQEWEAIGKNARDSLEPNFCPDRRTARFAQIYRRLLEFELQ